MFTKLCSLFIKLLKHARFARQSACARHASLKTMVGGVNFQISNHFPTHTPASIITITQNFHQHHHYIFVSLFIYDKFKQSDKAIKACRASRAAMLFHTVYCLERPASVLHSVEISRRKTHFQRQ